MAISRFEQIQHIDPKTLLKEGAHVIVFGKTGSGKTSILLWLAIDYYRIGETVVWRDSGSLESFSLLGVVPMKVFVPEDCEFLLKHEHLEHFHFDPKRPEQLFSAFDPEKVNVIVFDYFCYENEVKLRFWTRFFESLWEWKSSSMKRIRMPITLIIDEFNFICPGDRRHQIAGQQKLNSNMYQSMASFRKWRIRLVASSHNPNDVFFPVRQQFSFKIYKKTSRQAVPAEHWNYAHHFPKLAIHEAIAFDEDDDFNKIRKVPHLITPRKIVVPRRGRVTRMQVLDEEETPRKSAQKWRNRTVKLARLLMEKGEVDTYKELGDLLGVSDSYAWKLLNDAKGEEEP